MAAKRGRKGVALSRLPGLVATFFREERTVARLGTLPVLNSSFEGWLHYELAAWFMSERSIEAGVEYRAGVDGGGGKWIDLWLASNRPNRWHYIEIKIVFPNGNVGKMKAACQKDLAAVRGIRRDEGADGRALLLLLIDDVSPADFLAMGTALGSATGDGFQWLLLR